MKTSVSIAAISAALAKANMQGAHPSIEAEILSSFSPIKITPGRGHAARPLIDRLFERVICGMTDCWHVVSVKNGFGYARMSYQGRQQMMHRLSFIAFNGPIPDGMYVLHKCDNRACINPEHLFLGTYSDNIRDCYAKGRRNAKGRTNENK